MALCRAWVPLSSGPDFKSGFKSGVKKQKKPPETIPVAFF
jgi:hypothetical protein